VAIRITVWIQGLFSGFVTIGRYGKRYQPTALRDTSRYRHSNYDVITSPAVHLAEVCSVPMLLVSHGITSSHVRSVSWVQSRRVVCGQ